MKGKVLFIDIEKTHAEVCQTQKIGESIIGRQKVLFIDIKGLKKYYRSTRKYYWSTKKYYWSTSESPKNCPYNIVERGKKDYLSTRYLFYLYLPKNIYPVGGSLMNTKGRANCLIQRVSAHEANNDFYNRLI